MSTPQRGSRRWTIETLQRPDGGFAYRKYRGLHEQDRVHALVDDVDRGRSSESLGGAVGRIDRHGKACDRYCRTQQHAPLATAGRLTTRSVVMLVWIDIENPPQVQYLAPFKAVFEALGHSVIVTSQDNSITLDLLGERRISAQVIGRHGGGSKIRKASRVFKRSVDLGVLLGESGRISCSLRRDRPLSAHGLEESLRSHSATTSTSTSLSPGTPACSCSIPTSYDRRPSHARESARIDSCRSRA